jgi:hypothetical protein
MDRVTQELEDEGVQSFMDSFSEVVAQVDKRRRAVVG